MCGMIYCLSPHAVYIRVHGLEDPTGVDDERARQGRADGERDAQGAHDRTSQIAHAAHCASEKKVHMSI